MIGTRLVVIAKIQMIRVMIGIVEIVLFSPLCSQFLCHCLFELINALRHQDKSFAMWSTVSELDMIIANDHHLE